MSEIPCETCICLPTCMTTYRKELLEYVSYFEDDYKYEGPIVILYGDCKILHDYIYDENGNFKIQKPINSFDLCLNWWREFYGIKL